MMRTTLTIILILFTTSYSQLQSQIIRGLPYNHAIVGAERQHSAVPAKAAGAPIEFSGEFFEDFSDYRDKVFPGADRFTDQCAFINSTWADSMISLGVATLDACDQYGYPYYGADSGTVASDTLTSQPFNFPEGAPEELYFSFFYQAGGLGDLPEGIISEVFGIEGEDSLVLEFFAPEDSLWVQTYYTLDNTKPDQFNKIEISLADRFRMDGFQFRFRNYTSLPSLNEQGIDLGQFENDDMWHIDYIRLTTEATNADTFNLGDLCINQPLLPSLEEYAAVPWDHYGLALSTIERRQINLSVQDYGANNGNPIFFQRHYRATDLADDGDILNSIFREREFDGFEAEDFEDDFTTGFYYDDSKTVGELEIRAYLETEADQPHVNDTVVRKDIYYDHYAYDDGTAEAGFGIDGEYQDLSKTALRFRTFVPDTLQAILIYFVKSIDSATYYAEYQIEIRKNDGNKPSNEVLYVSDILSPDYSTGINEFTRIELNPPLQISDTFFVVIHQQDGYLNLGYDINTNTTDKLYNYLNHDWYKPNNMTPGTPMIRASFGSHTLPTDLPAAKEQGDFRVYPNPAGDILNLSLPDASSEPMLIQVFNITGALQYSQLSDERSLSVAGLKSGFYFISVSSLDGQQRFNTKFIKQ